jgi:hypothetical protein
MHSKANRLSRFRDLLDSVDGPSAGIAAVLDIVGIFCSLSELPFVDATN